jgi:hypothetical protein
VNGECGVQNATTEQEKKRQLFLSQKELLDQFLKSGAISATQYDTSLN